MQKGGILYLESMRRGVMLIVGVTVSNLPGRLYRGKKILRQRQHRGCILEHTSQQCRVQSIVPGLHVNRAHSNETMAADATCCARHCDSFVLANASTRPSTISHHCVVGNSWVSLFRVCQELGGSDYEEENLSHRQLLAQRKHFASAFEPSCTPHVTACSYEKTCFGGKR